MVICLHGNVILIAYNHVTVIVYGKWVRYTLSEKNVEMMWTFHTFPHILAFSTLTWGGVSLSYLMWLLSWSIVCGFSISNNRHLTDKVDFPPQMKCHQNLNNEVINKVENAHWNKTIATRISSACRLRWQVHIITMISLAECTLNKIHWMNEDIPWSWCCTVKSLFNDRIFTQWNCCITTLFPNKSKKGLLEYPHSFNDSFLRAGEIVKVIKDMVIVVGKHAYISSWFPTFVCLWLKVQNTWLMYIHVYMFRILFADVNRQGNQKIWNHIAKYILSMHL